MADVLVVAGAELPRQGLGQGPGERARGDPAADVELETGLRTVRDDLHLQPHSLDRTRLVAALVPLDERDVVAPDDGPVADRRDGPEHPGPLGVRGTGCRPVAALEHFQGDADPLRVSRYRAGQRPDGLCVGVQDDAVLMTDELL